MHDGGHAQRIVSLLPSATEILYALGLGERIVGVTHECDYPPAARVKPQLTSSLVPGPGSSASSAQDGSPAESPPEDSVAQSPSRIIDRHVRERVHAGSSLYALDSALLEELAPDLIVTQELCAVCAVSYEIVARAAKRLRGDARIVSLEPSSFEDVFANIATLGDLTATARSATTLIGRLRARLELLRRHVAAQGSGRPRPRTLVLEWTDPPMSAGHWTADLVDLSGGEPVLANPAANSVVLEWEAIAAADPDVVLVAPCGYALPASKRAAACLDALPLWRELRAVKERRAYAVDGNAYLNRPGPRLVDTAELFATALFDRRYGAAFTDRHAIERL